MSVLGERVKSLTTRMGVRTFGMAIALFESNFLESLVRLRHKGRALLAAPSGPAVGAVQPGVPPSRPAQREKPRLRSDQSQWIGSGRIHPSTEQRPSEVQPGAGKSEQSAFDRLPAGRRFQLTASMRRAPPLPRLLYRSRGIRGCLQALHTHSPDFERLCFQRWFILRDFLTAHRIEQCVYLDSDVMLYGNVTEDMAKFRLFDFTVCWNTIGCVLFVNRVEGLVNFCQFIMDIYTKKDEYHYDKMVANFAVRRRHQLMGGATDMTAFELYGELNFGQVGEASFIIDGSTYDPNINMPQPGFEMADKIKKVIWQDHQPYGIYVPTGEMVRFNSLHFNGKAKALMPEYCTALLDQPVP